MRGPGLFAILFADLDVLAMGAVVDDVPMDFDRYWDSESSYPVSLILPEVDAAVLRQLETSAQRVAGSEAGAEYARAIRDSGFMAEFLEGDLAAEWTHVRMVSDDPAKGLGKAKSGGLLIHQLDEILGRPAHSVELISPYFVPTAAGVEVFTQMIQHGVKLRILTNSLGATDVVAVHAGYAKRRQDLLAAGATLYGLRRMAGKTERPESAGPFGSSGSSLHAKTFAVDDARVFVGSFNFDPRSALLDTELGFIIESPNMARQIGEFFSEKVSELSYEVRLSEAGDLYWIERRDGEQIRHDTEPETGILKRGFVRFLSILPIEGLL